jgi:2-oxoglutarate ferredoxin oxidoreductase subunit alpha
MSSPSVTKEDAKPIVELSSATVRFCGDSGDGMQLAGTQLTNTSALMGNDVATLPDFPAEIRAPRGTKAGVSGFQIHFASKDIFTPGDQVDCLVAMNPAALVTNQQDLVDGGILIANVDAFNDKKGLKQAGYETNPLEDDSLSGYQLIQVEFTRLTRLAVDGLGLSQKEADRCRNFYAMGLVFWLYDRSMDSTLRYIEDKFGKRPEVAEANRRALKAGHAYGETTEAFISQYRVDRAALPPGTYRNITGNQATAWGLMAASKLSKCNIFLGTYPITPASDILHELSKHKQFDIATFQAEDEIAAVTSALGASFGGSLAVTTSSGPGIALKGEAIALGVMMELPLLIVSVQRGGPSTGLPTKVEQADLLQAMYGRNGECPVAVLAPQSPGDCFYMAIEAWRIATRFMTPVFLMTDAYLANGSEPWRIPPMESLEAIEVRHPAPTTDGKPFFPYVRNERLARPWAVPGTPGLMHRLGGLEKQDGTGNVSYDPENHQKMVELRQAKISGIAHDIPPQSVEGPESGDLLILGWGSTYGAIATAVRNSWETGASVAHAQLRYVSPFPSNLGDVLSRYRKVLIPELNLGQLRKLIRAEYLIDAIGLNKVQGKPFTVQDIQTKIDELLN